MTLRFGNYAIAVYVVLLMSCANQEIAQIEHKQLGPEAMENIAALKQSDQRPRLALCDRGKDGRYASEVAAYDLLMGTLFDVRNSGRQFYYLALWEGGNSLMYQYDGTIGEVPLTRMFVFLRNNGAPEFAKSVGFRRFPPGRTPIPNDCVMKDNPDEKFRAFAGWPY